jgi:CHAD domain-containing protein
MLSAGIGGERAVQNDHDAVRLRAFELSLGPDSGSPEENWLRAEWELATPHDDAVAYDYDTVDRDLERRGLRLERLPGEAGAVWRLTLPRGEQVEAWEPGNRGLTPPDEIASLVDAVAAGKPLAASPPRSDEPGTVRLREMLAEQGEQLLVHDAGTRLGVDAENLHQHRVAARRTRAFMRAARAYVDDGWRASLDGALRQLGTATGPVRDLDVLLEHVRAEAETFGAADRSGADLLLQILGQRHDAARARLLRALDAPSYRALPERLRVPPRLADGVKKVPLERIARKELRRLLETVDALGAKPNDRTIHSLRIRLKRVRYAAELAAVEPRKAHRHLFEAAKLLQDLLGEHQDAVVAEARLREATVVDTGTAAAFVAGRLAERQVRRRAAVHAQLPHAWKLLRKRAKKI